MTSNKIISRLLGTRLVAFHMWMLHGLLVLALVLRAVEPSNLGSRFHLLREKTRPQPLHLRPAACGSWVSHSHDFTLPTNLEMFSVLPRYKSPLQIDLSW